MGGTFREKAMYSVTTDQIRINVRAEHLEETSLPDDGVFAFSYTIQIENISDEPLQLLERHWVVSSGGVQIAEIVGPGLLGDQPVVESGEIYEYSSATVIQDPLGFMEGSYTFRTCAGEFLEVPVPRFDLAYPLVIH